jgi:hypothetical protein
MTEAQKEIIKRIERIERKMKTTVTNGDKQVVEIGNAITQIWNDIAIIRDINNFWQLLKRRKKLFIGLALFFLLLGSSAGIDYIILVIEKVMKIIG